MIKRIALLAALGLFPVALYLLWPKVRKQFTTAEVAVAVVRQPREEVLITGFAKIPGVQPFSIQTLSIEEPGKEPYRRLISLDAENAFELTLGKPAQGGYRAGILVGKTESGTSMPERWLTTPQITLDARGGAPSNSVTAREYDQPRLFTVAGMCAAVWMVLLAVCFRTLRAGVQKAQ